MKIKEVSYWSVVQRGQAVDVFEVSYHNGNIRRYYSDYSRSIPKTVEAFIDSHCGIRINSQCIVYK